MTIDMNYDYVMEDVINYPKRKWTHSDDHELKTLLRKGMSLRDISPIVNRSEGGLKARINTYRKVGEFIYLPQIPDRGWYQHDINHLQSLLIDHNMFHVAVFNPDVIAEIYIKTGRRALMIIRKVCEINSIQYRDAGLTLSRCTDNYIGYLTNVIHELTNKSQQGDSNTLYSKDNNIMSSDNIQ